MHRLTTYAKKTWHFIWHSNSIYSWLANIILAILIVKFILYPGLSALFGTTHPVVAVISDSMDHDLPLEEWYRENSDFYHQYNIALSDFKEFPLKNGFNKGDLIVVFGIREQAEIGDVVVFWAGENYPIIHRVINATTREDMQVYTTKGDNNNRPIIYYVNRLGQPVPPQTPGAIAILDETNVVEGDLIGRGVFRIPFLGNLKIWAVEGIQYLTSSLS